ncbi:MAG: group 1 glycosyl transferase [Bacteroidota bacterium]
MPTLVFTVTNELSFDQRMQRICGSLAKNGYEVWLIGRKIEGCPPLDATSFKQLRINCFSKKGPLFYFEFNLRLFLYLLFKKADLICAIDLDTILACYFASIIKGTKRIYDAHEYFTEQKEVATRPAIKRIWLAIERFTVPKFKNGYTVNKWIADALKQQYLVNYEVIRNLPLNLPYTGKQSEKSFIIYQGAVNEGRCFEQLIPAMKEVAASLKIFGTGNFINQTISIINDYSLKYKIEVNKPLSPAQLRQITGQATIGITLFDNQGLSQVHSLANRFFDYIMAGIPQLCIDFPEYRALNDAFNVAYLIPNTEPQTIADALNKLLTDHVLYGRLQSNCLDARKKLNWDLEETHLINYYKQLF